MGWGVGVGGCKEEEQRRGTKTDCNFRSFGVVYKAIHLDSQHEVAVKIIEGEGERKEKRERKGKSSGCWSR